MKVEIDSENLLTLQILAAVLQTDVATVTNDCIVWHLTLPLGNRGVSFLAEQIAGWPFDSEQDAICAAEKFNEVAVSANLEDKTEFLFTTEVVEEGIGEHLLSVRHFPIFNMSLKSRSLDFEPSVCGVAFPGMADRFATSIHVGGAFLKLAI
jgi:hypothetical protein